MKTIQIMVRFLAVCLALTGITGPLYAQGMEDLNNPWNGQPSGDYDNAVSTVQNQLSALKQGDTSKAYYAYTTKDFRKNFSLEEFRALVRRFKVFGLNRAFQAEDHAFEGSNIVKIKGKLIASDGDSVKVVYDIVLEDGEWKIHNIQLVQQLPRGRLKNAAGPSPKA